MKIKNCTKVILWMICFFSLTVTAQQKDKSKLIFTSLGKKFLIPPDSVKPAVYWYWLSDNISEEGVTRDLEAMAKVGIGCAFIGNIGLDSSQTRYGKVKLFSDEWWNVLHQAFKTATKLGIEIGLFNSPGWSQSGGPWVKTNQSMRYLASSELKLVGPQKYSGKLSSPHKDFKDVTVLAFPSPKDDGKNISDFNPRISSNIKLDGINKLVDGKVDDAILFPKEINDSTIVSIDIEVNDLFPAQSLIIYPAAKKFTVDCELFIKKGEEFVSIKKFNLDRSNDGLNVGFIPFAPVCISFPEISSKQFRLVLKKIQCKGSLETRAAGLAEIEISSAPKIERYMEKQLAKMFQTPLPLWNEYQWQNDNEPTDKSLMINPDQVIDISKHLTKDGILNWDVPAGKWIVLQLGMVPTGVTNGPATPEGRGLETDKMSKENIETHFNSFVGEVLKRILPEDRKTFKYVVADSYETGSQNWTDRFADTFQKTYGYSPFPFLPTLSGRIVGSADQSNRFLWDLRRLVADMVAKKYVRGLKEISNKHGLKLWLENYGHWGFPSEFLMYGGASDEISGEFWAEGDLGSIELRDASSAAHIYGKNKVWAESFTLSGKAFTKYPATIKKRADWSFTEGINNTLLHVYIEQPYENFGPGVNAWFGVEFNRKNTWFDQSKYFINYLRRCMFMLQQGKAVCDVAYFIGDDAPKMTGVRDPELPNGYSFDYINSEVIMKRLSVKNGKLVLPDGMSYSLLALPKLKTMRPEVLRKLKQLVQDGAVVIGSAPENSPSLQNYNTADDEIKKISKELWGNVDGEKIKINHFGKGMVINGMNIQQVMDMIKLVPDFIVENNKPVLFTHRTMKGKEIYFITNQSEQLIEFSASFRITGKQPEYWDAVSGVTRILPDFVQSKTNTKIPLKLEPYQSCFVVFKDDIIDKKKLSTKENFPKQQDILDVQGQWEVSFDKKFGGPEKPVLFNQLIDWSNHSDDNIKYYSGSAVYKNNFVLNEIIPNKNYFLDLGNVYAMALVKVNGKLVGDVWTAPYQIDVTNYLQIEKNEIEIEVVNTWLNRIIGDCKLPNESRHFTLNANRYNSESKLQPSGLIGPVKIKVVTY